MTETMTQPNSLLLDVLDELTKPQRQRITQDVWETKIGRDGRPILDTDGQPLRILTERKTTTTVTQPPLLTQLEDAIHATIGRSGGGGVEKHARNVLDSDALFQAMRIMATITDWCATVRIRATREPVRDLRAWYAARLATNPESDGFHVKTLRSWVGMIRSKIHRPESWEVKAPCPACHYSTWVDEYEREDGSVGTVERNRPVIVEYWPNARDVLASATATCRRCGMEWRGEHALRAMRWEVDAAETRGATASG